MKPRLTPFGLALFTAGTTFAALSPVPITTDSYTADVVVEKNATPVLQVVTTASVDNGTNNTANTWMEVGYDPNNPLNGLPPAGTVLTPYFGDTVLGNGVTVVAGVNTNNPSVTKYSFRLPPTYVGPNGILIDTVVPTATWTLTTPAAYTRLSFVGSGGNGGDTVGVIVRHQDGSVETYNPAPGVTNNAYVWGCPDWFSGTSNVLFIAGERCNNTANLTFGDINTQNPRFYFRDIVLTNTTSPVTSVVMNYVSGPASSHNAIFCLSGAKTVGGNVEPITVTGYTYDFVVEAAAAKRGRVLAANGIDNATSQSMDNIANTGNAWYEVGYNINNPTQATPLPDPTMITTGLPAPGSLITNSTGERVYRMPPDYTTNNAVWVAVPPAINAATITFVTPTAASVLSLLGSAGNGPVNNVMFVCTHADASTETFFVNVPNWFDANPFIFGANGRVAVDTAQINNARNTALNPRLYPLDLVLANTTSPVTKIDVTNTNAGGGRVAIFAVSSTTGAILPNFVTNPTFRTVSSGANVQFTASANANEAITYRWQKGTNGVFANLSDGGNISGATTTTLSVNNVTLADAADYRCVATDSVGSVNSSSAFLTILSPLLDVTTPSDPISFFGITGIFGDGAVARAIDDSTLKFGGNIAAGSPCGLIVSPIAGPTIVTGLRIYCANDTTARDPSSFKLEGSLDGGATYTLIASNSLTLSDTRSPAPAATTPIDPLTQAMTQVLFANANGYATYRLTFPTYKGGSGQTSFQIGEVEFLGVPDNSGRPFFTVQPVTVGAFVGATVFFDASASGTPTPSLFWRKGTNGVYVNLTDDARISGSKTGSLTINGTQAGDVADYVCVASNSVGSGTSAIAKLLLVSTNTDVTVASDPITSFGGTVGAPNGGNGNAPSAIDDLNSSNFQNGGSGLNYAAGFAPFGGPVGLEVTPAVGTTRLVGLRIYTATGNNERDPSDYKLEGSNDGGTNYTLISQGPLDLPLARANNALAFDPTVQPMQEILFANNQAYATYRLTFNHTRNDNISNSLQIGEVEFLGVPASPLPPSPVLSISYGAGKLTITTTSPGTLYSTTNLTAPVWKSEGAISGSVVITPLPGEPTKFYQTR